MSAKNFSSTFKFLIGGALLFLGGCSKEEILNPESLPETITSKEHATEFPANSTESITSNQYSGSFFYSYEGSLQGWGRDATDLELNNGEIDWHILPKTTRPYQGYYSLEYYLNNLNDAGKIWIEKPFNVTPNRCYNVTVSYKFATRDFGTINNFTLITGVSTKNPEVAADLTFQGSTGNGSDSDIGYRWLSKSYSFQVTANSLGKLWVSVGVWGTWEGARTYYFDNVSIKIVSI